MRRAFPVAFAALVAALGLAGAWLLFTTFRTYDDEGYVLFSLANFARDGGLYTRIYSQYGPGFFLLADAAHRLLGFEFTTPPAAPSRFFTGSEPPPSAATSCGAMLAPPPGRSSPSPRRSAISGK